MRFITIITMKVLYIILAFSVNYKVIRTIATVFMTQIDFEYRWAYLYKKFVHFIKDLITYSHFNQITIFYALTRAFYGILFNF